MKVEICRERASTEWDQASTGGGRGAREKGHDELTAEMKERRRSGRRGGEASMIAGETEESGQAVGGRGDGSVPSWSWVRGR